MASDPKPHAVGHATNGAAPVMTPKLYNQNAMYQHRAMQPSISFLEQAAASVPVSPGKPIVIADLGASHGINSIQPVKAILAALAARTPAGQTQEVAVYHEDLPSNDFSELIALIQDPQRSYLPQHQLVTATTTTTGGVSAYSYLVPRSYYERLFPSASVHITFAFTTLHFLSSRPALNRASLFTHRHPDPAFRVAFDAQARSDLTSFLRLRAVETVPGGALVAHLPVLDPDSPQQWGMGMHLLEQVVQEHLADGRLSAEELGNMTPLAYLRSPQDVMDVLDSAVGQHWSIKKSFVLQVEDTLPAQLAAGELDAAGVADAVCNRVGAVLKGWMAGQLALTRGREEAEKAVERMFEEFRGKVEAAPHQQGPLPFIYLYLERTTERCA